MKRLAQWALRAFYAVLTLAAAAAGLFVLLVGPWPLYADARHRQQGYYREALAAITASAAESKRTEAPGPLHAGWAEREFTPARPGHPLAGYGGRANDKRSAGSMEPMRVRALALNDGEDTVVLLGSDLLQTLPNLLDLITPRVHAATGLTDRNLMYTSSHTHCGPGGWAPGLVGKEAFGEYDPAYLEQLATAFSEAIIEAHGAMGPATFAHGEEAVPEFIRNRARASGAVDTTLHAAKVVRKDTGAQLLVARYSAHGTVYGEECMRFNNDFAGAFQRAVQERAGAPLLYMGGAVGSMRPYPPGPPMPVPWNRQLELAFENDVESQLVREGKKTLEQLLADQQARAEAMGQALCDRLLATVNLLTPVEHIDIASLAAPFTPPPAQVRLFSPHWRVSPFLFRLLGVPTTGRIQAARVGDLLLVGLPYDVSGECSAEWQTWTRPVGTALWVTSFSGAYLGYLTPDRYYHEMGEGYHYNQNYEVGQMGWFGPNQEAYVADLVRKVLEVLPSKAPQGAQ